MEDSELFSFVMEPGRITERMDQIREAMARPERTVKYLSGGYWCAGVPWHRRWDVMTPSNQRVGQAYSLTHAREMAKEHQENTR